MCIFQSRNERQVKKLKATAEIVLALESKYATFSDAELKECTADFKKRLADGATLEDILPEAFAVVREAAWRVLGMKHYPVQIMGGIALFQGRIAEMATGEGKTLVSTLPVYLSALSGKGVHVVTVNEYLASRDAEWMGKIHKFLGLTVGVILNEMSPDDKRVAYNCDITYGTNNEFGFDYLRDNMASSKAKKVQRELSFAIVDEVDSILIDEARTPLIISGRGAESKDLYQKADRFVKTLTLGDPEAEKKFNEQHIKSGEESVEEESTKEVLDEEQQKLLDAMGDCILDEEDKAMRLTARGVRKAERFFGVEELTAIENSELYHHINQALKARFVMIKDRDYIVNDNEVIIVDENTGRLMIGRRYSEGLHQAIEAKEGVIIRNESKTYATITFQNYFRLYNKLSGMTGTAKTEEAEFEGIYGLDVVVIPPNLPRKRIDENDRLYKSVKGKYNAILDDIEECHKKGQPVLVGTVSVEKSETISALLKKRGIRHNLLNAKNHEQEAMIVAQAGQKGSVTIATNMAGRGTDIMLGGNAEFMAKEALARKGYTHEVIEVATSYLQNIGPDEQKARELYEKYYNDYKTEVDKAKAEVVALGGLRVIGTERHESRRIDNQLRGRSGRQGDPGSSVFYISMEDDLARIFGGELLQSVASRFNLPEDMPITIKTISTQIERAQLKVENRNYSARKQVLAYDDVMNYHREVVYQERQKVLDGLDMHDQIAQYIPDVAIDMVREVIDLDKNIESWDYTGINKFLESRILPKGSNVITLELANKFDEKAIIDAVTEKALEGYEAKRNHAKELGIDFADLERQAMLHAVDKNFVEHIDAMDNLRKGIGLRALGNQDPVMGYRNEGNEMFEHMVDCIRHDVVTEVLTIDVDGFYQYIVNHIQAPKHKSVFPDDLEVNGKGIATRKDAKVGRNDPCPCGSGKKYKQCCGK